MSIIKQKDAVMVEEILLEMPWYVDQFIRFEYQEASPSTLLGYLYNYRVFLNWLLEEGFYQKSEKIKEIPLGILEKLRADDIKNYQAFLSMRRKNGRKAITRNINALRSLFYYLSQIAEDENYYPLLKRNVMARIKGEKRSKSASVPMTKLFLDDEVEEFLHFIAHDGYKEVIKDKKISLLYYERDKERDAAITALILYSGLRVSEVVNLDLEDINIDAETQEDNNFVYVLGKGGNDINDKVAVGFNKKAIPFLLEYLAIRETRYTPKQNEKALFLSLRMGAESGSRMLRRGMQDMVIKYARAFGKDTTIHKLRHSLGTNYNKVNGIHKTKKQLRHSDFSSTEIYAHISDTEMKDAIDKI